MYQISENTTKLSTFATVNPSEQGRATATLPQERYRDRSVRKRTAKKLVSVHYYLE